MVFDTPMYQNLALYLHFEDTKNMHVHKVLIWGFGGYWRFLTGVWQLDLYLDTVSGLWCTDSQNSLDYKRETTSMSFTS